MHSFMKYEELVTVELDLISKLNNKENFSFARYGDGEWNCIMNKQGRNCDAHIYFPHMGEALRNALCNNDYYIGLQTLAHRMHPDFVTKVSKENNLKWCRSDFLHHWSINNNKEHAHKGKLLGS